jgi:hypothetical protein
MLSRVGTVVRTVHRGVGCTSLKVVSAVCRSGDWVDNSVKAAMGS